jgi:hypothetical protein
MRPTARPAHRSAAALAAAVALLAGCMTTARPPQDLDYSRTRASAAGVYRATIRPPATPFARAGLQRWTLHLETAAGAPVDSAAVTVGGGMPQHGTASRRGRA